MAKNEIAVLGVDPQVDFCPGGLLGVAEGDLVMEPLNAMFDHAKAQGWKTALSRDWHPEGTAHFEKWPVHCVQESEGADFHPALRTEGITIFSKGLSMTDDGYSPFEGVDSDGRNLDEFLDGTQTLYVGGLATDYCVRAAVLDALRRNFDVHLLTDAIRAVDLNPGDGDKAIAEMVEAGAKLTTTEVVIFGEGA